MEDQLPVLGVCRGLQLMNLAAGGTLYQDLADQMPGSIKHDYFPFEGNHRRDHLAHEVTVAAGSRIAGMLDADRVRVNSMHHQGIRDLGAGLVATATAPDGLIEGAESADGSFFVGVQWHPEALTDTDPRMRRLFDELVVVAGERNPR
jgi:putative glutamine amidotransferase